MLIKRFIKFIYSKCCTLFCRKQIGKCGNNLHINFPCKFTKKTIIGNNCHFNGIEISGSGNVIIGDNFHSGKSCRILTSNHNYEGNKIPYDETMITRNVIIGDNVWLGERVMILAGVNIGEGAIIQAGSVVVKDIPKCAIAGGHPAVVFKLRDREHYEKLKAKKAFF